MEFTFKENIEIANKWILLFSGLNKKYSIHWSKSLIKQLLTYLSLCDNKGLVGIIDLEAMSSLLNCSLRTLSNNNKTLADVGIIKLDNLYGDLTYIEILDSQIPFEMKNGSNDSLDGYVSINRNTFSKILKIQDLNALRLACYIIFVFETEVGLNGKKSAILTNTMLKAMLPKYCSNKPIIRQFLESFSNLFDLIFLEDESLIRYLKSLTRSQLNELLFCVNPRDSFLVIIKSIK